MSLAYVRSPRIITFVGRPLASRKGLTTLLDAVAVLETLDRLPSYQIWLVGGDVGEQRFLDTIVLGHPMLEKVSNNGRLLAWGAVENTFLPEIYSRSTVVVIPSTFEQFGLVAIEAMACGCPVAASDVGGMRDTIVPSITGELFPADDAETLANILAGYLRNPRRREYQSSNAQLWARKFSTARVYQMYYEAVCENRSNDGCDDISPEREWRRQVIDRLLPECAQLLGKEIAHSEDCSGNSQISACLTTVHGDKYYAKFLQPRPSTHSLILPLPHEQQGPGTPAHLVHKFEYFRESGLTPTVLATSPNHGIVLTEWLLKPQKRGGVGIEAYFDLAKRFEDWGKTDPEINEFNRSCLHALRDYSLEQNDKTLAALDHAVALLHAPMLGGAIQFHGIHPQVELFRIFSHLKAAVWSLPLQVRSRLESLLSLLIRARPVIVDSPKLKHGSLKPSHVFSTSGKYVACDLDNAIYAVGPLDAVHWCVGEGSIEDVDLRETLKRLSDVVDDEIDFFLAAGWLFVYLIYGLLDAVMKGRKGVCDTVISSLINAYEGLFKHGLIQSQ